MRIAFFDRWTRRTPAKPVKQLFYTEDSSFMVPDLDKICKDLHQDLWEYQHRKKTLTHETLQACARFLFGVPDLPCSMWRLRYCEKSMLYFKLDRLQPVFHKKQVVQLYLVFIDDSMGSNLQLQIEIRELWSMMEPVPPIDLTKITKSKAAG